MNDYPHHVKIVEVGPRDGLQNELSFVDTAIKRRLIEELSLSGLQFIEVTSFVSEKSIPQLRDNVALFSSINQKQGIHYSALVPNEQGMLKALKAGVKEIAIFTAASESFTQRNINCSIAQSLDRFKPVLALAKENNILVRAYISCALGCPYEGAISPLKVARLSEQLLALEVNEICLGDTIGVGTPKQTQLLIEEIISLLPFSQLSMHFHDTYGQAIANIYASLCSGVYQFDSAVAGLGGCPYARGASGNVATEDVLYLMHGLGIETGVDIFQIVKTGDMICKVLGKKNPSKVANALLFNKHSL